MKNKENGHRGGDEKCREWPLIAADSPGPCRPPPETDGRRNAACQAESLPAESPFLSYGWTQRVPDSVDARVWAGGISTQWLCGRGHIITASRVGEWCVARLILLVQYHHREQTMRISRVTTKVQTRLGGGGGGGNTVLKTVARNPVKAERGMQCGRLHSRFHNTCSCHLLSPNAFDKIHQQRDDRQNKRPNNYSDVCVHWLVDLCICLCRLACRSVHTCL